MPTTIKSLVELFRGSGGKRFFAKMLAPNDNSKNQIYFGGDFSSLSLIPHEKIVADYSTIAGSKRDRVKAHVPFSWVTKDGRFEAPEAKLVLYPKYPEVRFSGFLKGCGNAPRDIMSSRDEGRILFLSITDAQELLGFVAKSDSPLTREFLSKLTDIEPNGVFYEFFEEFVRDTKDELLKALRRVHCLGWIQSKKLGADGTISHYSAANGGGYTLEAELGIAPNSLSEPDYLGWEIKQFGVNNLENCRPKSPVTLFTPEPTGGYYQEQGVEQFIRKYGYLDKNGRPSRMNFGGIYAYGRPPHPDTSLVLGLEGYNQNSQKVDDINGGVILTDPSGNTAAKWDFISILKHWNRKHNRAAYVPSIARNNPRSYMFGAQVELGFDTDFLRFISAVSSGDIYLDPGIKMENMTSPKPRIKRRSQFRIKHGRLFSLYSRFEKEVL